MGGLRCVSAVALAACAFDSHGVRAQQIVGPVAVAPEPPREAIEESWQPPASRVFRFDPTKVDLSLGSFAQLTATRTTGQDGNLLGVGGSLLQNTAGATPSAGVLATFHQQFRGWIGYDINAAWTRLAVNYTLAVQAASPTNTGAGTANYQQASIGADMYEVSLGYVVKAPTSSHRIQTFAEFGGGMLAFRPTQPNFPGSVNFRPAALFGVGADYRLSDHFGLRVQYRGMFLKTPDFIRNDAAYPTAKLFTVTSEPTVSLNYTFGAHPRMQ